ncbi:MAG: RNB domain-containing ribonuclease [Gordonia sp. (in: high G+C Gram-positive bacteria)]
MRARQIDFGAVRAELGIVADFPEAVTAEGSKAVDRCADRRTDRTDLELVTIDPPGSMDLDQALRVVADDDGFDVHYAIADVAALVAPGGAVDAESRRRGQTVYFPDGSVPLHPRVLSEGLGSLLPDQTRPAVLWTVRVDRNGDCVHVDVERALVRSRARLDYAGVMAAIDTDSLPAAITGLPSFGEVRETWALARGAVQLELPDQEAVPHDGGRAWTLQLAPSTPADRWNAQVSLLIGMCAGKIMLDAGVGLLRTLPPAAPEAVGELAATASNLKVDWPAGLTPGQFLAGLDPAAPTTLALMTSAARLMRGAGYLMLDAASSSLPEAKVAHAGVGGVYAHVTAPLRRLADRFATEVCLAVTAGEPVPDWTLDALPSLGKTMSASDSVASTANRRSIDLAEAVVLSDQVGARFAATVMRSANGKRPAEIFIASPAIIAACDPAPDAGTRCQVELTEADPVTTAVEFRVV